MIASLELVVSTSRFSARTCHELKTNDHLLLRLDITANAYATRKTSSGVFRTLGLR